MQSNLLFLYSVTLEKHVDSATLVSTETVIHLHNQDRHSDSITVKMGKAEIQIQKKICNVQQVKS